MILRLLVSSILIFIASIAHADASDNPPVQSCVNVFPNSVPFIKSFEVGAKLIDVAGTRFGPGTPGVITSGLVEVYHKALLKIQREARIGSIDDTGFDIQGFLNIALGDDPNSLQRKGQIRAYELDAAGENLKYNSPLFGIEFTGDSLQTRPTSLQAVNSQAVSLYEDDTRIVLHHLVQMPIGSNSSLHHTDFNLVFYKGRDYVSLLIEGVKEAQEKQPGKRSIPDIQWEVMSRSTFHLRLVQSASND